jgi:hypothetical protein
MNAHILSDGSELKMMTARDLIRIPIWHGNRILDEHHLDRIRTDLKGRYESLDLSPYRVVTYPVFDHETDRTPILKTFIVDGQHRARLLNEWLQSTPAATDLWLTVVDKRCESEREVIEYFKLLNAIKPIQWKDDPNMAANPYLRELERAFNSRKISLIRPGKTRKPYLSVDSLREEFVKRRIGIGMKREPEEFARLVKEWNEYRMEVLQAEDPGRLDKTTKRALEMKFVLATDDSMRWLDEVLDI